IGLKEIGNEVHFLVYNQGDFFEHILENNNIAVHKFYKRNKFDVLSLFKAIGFMKNQKFDAIGAFLFTPSLYVLLFKLITFSKTKVLVSERSFHSEREEDYRKKIIRKLYRVSNVITANSISQTNYLKSCFPKLVDKIVYIPNGLNIDDFKIKTEHQPSNILKIVSIGHINSNKNTKLLIEAVKILRDTYNIETQVEWLGRTYEFLNEKNIYFEECKELISKYELQNHWNWAGKVKQIQNYLLVSDVLIHPSIGEGFPNAICEGLACGLPIIASNVNDHPHIIKNHSNGFLFNNNDLDDLIDKILRFKKLSIEDKRTMENQARKTAENNFQLSNMVAKYNEMFSL
ncbi:glycosyltransferase, partial [Aquimarina sp. Aq78]